MSGISVSSVFGRRYGYRTVRRNPRLQQISHAAMVLPMTTRSPRSRYFGRWFRPAA
jgi:hypothetical protein